MAGWIEHGKRSVACLSLITVLASGVHAMSLQGTAWQPRQIGEVAVPTDSGAFVRFESKGRLFGHSGCNRLMAEFQAADGQIFVGPVAATRMACSEELMALETALAQALENARSYQRINQRLVLFGSDGAPLVELEQGNWN